MGAAELWVGALLVDRDLGIEDPSSSKRVRRCSLVVHVQEAVPL